MTPDRHDAALEMRIDAMTAHDWSTVRAIYEAGIATGNATFQIEAPAWDAWNAGHLATCRLVARARLAVVGWTLQAGIFPENEASIALHQRVGFRVVGRREAIGCLGGQWRDVLLLERRSALIGR